MKTGTDKYEGHTPAPWVIAFSHLAILHEGERIVAKQQDTQLIADAPLLLAEVKRLREAIAGIADEMEQVSLTEYEQEVIEDLRKVIE